jgi:hypothetical protein
VSDISSGTYLFLYERSCVSLTSCQGEISHEICFSLDFSPLPSKGPENSPTTALLGSSCIVRSQENGDGNVGYRQAVETQSVLGRAVRA